MINHKDLHVVILDSDVDRREALRQLLTQLRVGDVIDASRAAEIRSDVQAGHKVIIILGDETPLGNAKLAIETLNKDSDIKAVPRILYTASDKPEYVREHIALGISGVIDEPLDPRQITAIFRNYLRRHNTAEVAALVQEAEFFKEFNKQELEILAKVAICRQYAAGETIITKDDPSDRFYVLLKGKVEILITQSGSAQMQLEVKPGHCFGEMGLLDATPRSAFCIAADDSQVLEIGSHIINDKDFSIRLKILTQMAFVLARRIRNMNSLIEHRQPQGVRELPTRSLAALRNKVKKVPTDLPTAEELFAPAAPREVEPDPAEDDIVQGAAPIEDAAEVNIEEDEAPKNPFAVPTGKAEEIDESIKSQEEFDVLTRKINLRTDFIVNKIPNPVVDVVCNKMYSYWTGSKLAKINPHNLWSPKWFTDGTPQLKRALHMVVLCDHGTPAYNSCYLELPLTHKVVGLSQVGCVGTFLYNREATERYFDKRPLKRVIQQDLELAIDRVWQGEDCIEFLTHTAEDVRPETLFLVFDDVVGNNTARVRKHFPMHQIVTVVQGMGFKDNDASSMFTYPEETLAAQGHLVPKEDYDGHGFYAGETTFIPDFSCYYEDTDAMRDCGYIFGTIGLFAQIGPDYSGVIWGSKGGADGAVKAARAMYGIKGAQSSEDLASAINWADD